MKNEAGNVPLELAKETVPPEQRHLPGNMEDLLREHGAMDNPPNWDRIEINRLSGQDPFTVFQKGTNAWNRFTLLDAILNYYETGFRYLAHGQGGLNGVFEYQVPGATPLPRQRENTMPFPDLSRVVIVRPSHDSTNETRITVNHLDSTNNVDCSKGRAVGIRRHGGDSATRPLFGRIPVVVK